jgi:hypothetical protein
MVKGLMGAVAVAAVLWTGLNLVVVPHVPFWITAILALAMLAGARVNT